MLEKKGFFFSWNLDYLPQFGDDEDDDGIVIVSQIPNKSLLSL